MADKADKKGVELSEAGKAYLESAASDKSNVSGIIMTKHEGTTHRIDIQRITKKQLSILAEKNHPFVVKN